MNRAFYIVGIVFSVVFLFIGAYFANEVHEAQWRSYFDTFSSNDLFSDLNFDSYYYEDEVANITFTASLWSLFFFLSFITIDLMGLLKVKTTTTKVFSIIGLSITGIFLIWNFAVMSSPGSIDFEEVYPGYLLYCFIMLSFSIVGLVQSVRYFKQQQGGGVASAASVSNDTDDLLDS
jgi:hypothetical protein